VAKNQPAEYVTICALLVPKEMKAEHFGGLSTLTDEELDAALDALHEMLAARAGEAANVIEGTGGAPRNNLAAICD
jgi:Ni,Fe-hydrogenase maturation factor